MTTLLETEPAVREADRSVQYSWVLASDVTHPTLPSTDVGTLEFVLQIDHTADDDIPEFVATVNIQVACAANGVEWTVSSPDDARSVLVWAAPYTGAFQRQCALHALGLARQSAAGGHYDDLLKHQETTDA